MVAPCDWPITTNCCPDWVGFPAAVQAEATAFATKVLWALSGRQYDSCPKTVRPCVRCVDQTYRTYGVWTDGWFNGSYGNQWLPYVDGSGNWRNCGCGAMCCCEPSAQVWLPGPVSAITEVRVNNVIIPAANYRVDVARGKYWLVGENGQQWPECQDFDQAASSPTDTFVVQYVKGTPVPGDGQAMAGLLACEYGKLCVGTQCALSPAATTITRDGVTYEILSAEDLIQKGLTMMPIVNQWIMAVNPRRLIQRPRIWSPDMDFPRETVIS